MLEGSCWQVDDGSGDVRQGEHLWRAKREQQRRMETNWVTVGWATWEKGRGGWGEKKQCGGGGAADGEVEKKMCVLSFL